MPRYFIKFTDTNNRIVVVNPEAVAFLRPDNLNPDACDVFFIGGTHLCVQGAIEEVARRLLINA